MKSRLIGLCVIFLVFMSSTVLAQLNSFNVKGVVAFQEDSLSATGDTLTQLKCKITLSDTLTIDQIHLKIGTILHGSDALTLSVPFDNTQPLPVGIQYERHGNVVFITIGYFLPAIYYLDVYLTDSFGNTSHTKSALL